MEYHRTYTEIEGDELHIKCHDCARHCIATLAEVKWISRGAEECDHTFTRIFDLVSQQRGDEVVYWYNDTGFLADAEVIPPLMFSLSADAEAHDDRLDVFSDFLDQLDD